MKSNCPILSGRFFDGMNDYSSISNAYISLRGHFLQIFPDLLQMARFLFLYLNSRAV